MARVVLAMSGGVDSSVAAHLLLEQGHEVIGVFMRHGQQSPVACASTSAAAPQIDAATSPDLARSGLLQSELPIVNRLDHKQGCCTAADAEDARRVADRLGIPFYALNLDREFGRIIDYFVAEYAAGRTPNPCVQCNNWIKFGKLFDYADSVGAEFVATGHYAQLGLDETGGPTLLRGRDVAKDQSYVLFGIERKFLSRMLLPVGEYEKPEIRRIAAGLGLNVAAKKDSQEICFVTSGRYDEFVKGRLNGGDGAAASGRSGEFVLTSGEVVGQHEGIEGFTVGQRKGLGVALGEPKFVVRIEADTKRVVLGDREELGRTELTAVDCNWLIEPDELPSHGEVQIRYNARSAAATIELTPAGHLQVRFDAPQFGVAPGQAAVCYDGQRVLGGGWIESHRPFSRRSVTGV
ncbi:MAG TPA: tRNA 2-thiouridine(34) synthase MnmA [Lacipirellula sp.]